MAKGSRSIGKSSEVFSNRILVIEALQKKYGMKESYVELIKIFSPVARKTLSQNRREYASFRRVQKGMVVGFVPGGPGTVCPQCNGTGRI
jgi:hypothetical protein